MNQRAATEEAHKFGEQTAIPSNAVLEQVELATHARQQVDLQVPTGRGTTYPPREPEDY